MLFSTYEFIFFFLPVSFVVYFYLNKRRLTTASKAWLVFSSLFFYSWWNVAYLPLILISMLFNYVVGSSLTRSDCSSKRPHKKTILFFGIVCNIALLGYFKYADFLISNINLISNTQTEMLNLALPLAISFFTFQQIAYLVDSFRSETQEYDFLNYAVFVSFFPQLIAGPIVHHKEMMPQFSNNRAKLINYKNILMGLFIFSIGLFKKVVIADSLAIWVSNGFDIATTLNFFEAWAVSLSYTFQLYFDFSGYADMAIGLALLFNIRLPINFNSPYKATNIQDFWRRWHMTLSRFLRDYVYIPLGGNRRGEFKTYINLLSTFIIGGIWHGAGWTFVFWGFLHGLAISVQRAWNLLGIRMWTWVSWLITFNFVNISWVFFRANEWSDAIKVLRGMFDFGSIVIPSDYKFTQIFPDRYLGALGDISPNLKADESIIYWILFSAIIAFLFKNSMQFIKYPELLESKQISILRLTGYAILLLIGLSAISLQEYTEFIYFNF
jgi:D-alanyl-lipoteichoic acid acyltransferase DltB (MBOAT superfamily)